MRVTFAILVCGALLTLDTSIVQAGEMADGSLGRRGGFIEYRSLLQSHNIRTLLAFNGTQAQPDHQAPPPLPARNETGQGDKQEPIRNFLPPSYHGPVINSTSGALAVKNRLTAGYPADGISCTIPATLPAGLQKPYNPNRPYTHSYPSGYTLLFIPSFAADYTGYHWAVYDKHHAFFSFDDSDATSGDYDYDDGHDLPAGCQYQAPPLQESTLAATSDGSHVSAPAPGSSSAATAEAAPLQAPTPAVHVGGGTNFSSIAPDPAPGRVLGNGTLVTAMQAAALKATDAGRSGQGKLLCRPIAATCS